MQKNDVQKVKRGFVPCTARGVIAGLTVILALLAIFAALVSSGRAPESAMSAMTWGAAFLGAMTGSVVAVRRFGSRALVTGVTVSAALFMLTLLGAAFSEERGLTGPMTPAIMLALFAGGVLGGFISPRRKAQRSRKRVKLF